MKNTTNRAISFEQVKAGLLFGVYGLMLMMFTGFGLILSVFGCSVSTRRKRA